MCSSSASPTRARAPTSTTTTRKVTAQETPTPSFPWCIITWPASPELDSCEKLIVYTDSCSGQNRNRFLYSYLIKRVLAGYHNEVSWNFMVVGHTQFSPDRGFGLMRKHVERRDAFTAPDPVNINNALTPKSNYKCVGREAEVAEFRDFKRCITDNLKPVDGIKSRDIAEIIIRAETVDAHRICRSFRRYIRSDELQEMPVIKRARTAEERALGEHLCFPRGQVLTTDKPPVVPRKIFTYDRVGSAHGDHRPLRWGARTCQGLLPFHSSSGAPRLEQEKSAG